MDDEQQQPARPPDSLVMPRFCGVAAFMRLPQASEATELDVAVLGLPSDNGSPYRTGARFGPKAIRDASVMLRPVNPYRGNVDVFSALRVADLGDAAVVPGYMPATLLQMETAVRRAADAGACPLLLGGDHGVSIAALRAVAGRHRQPLALVHFDAHSDTWDAYFGGERHSAGTPFRRAVEEGLVDPRRSLQLGLRGSLFSPDDVEQSRRLGYEVLSTDEMLVESPATLANRIARRTGGAPVYFSFDLGVVDPASAPGVQTPEAGGPSAREMLAILRALHGIEIVGADVVECNPLFDGPGAVTALLGATVAAEVLALKAVSR